MQLNLQPPYCDAESPTLINKPPPVPTTPGARSEDEDIPEGGDEEEEPKESDFIIPVIPTNGGTQATEVSIEGMVLPNRESTKILIQ